MRELGHTPTEIAVSLREAAEAIARDDPDLTIVVIYGDDEHTRSTSSRRSTPSPPGRSSPCSTARTPSSWPPQPSAGIFAYARQETADSIQSAIEVAMRRWREHHELEAQVARLENALERRALIERAKGILMERHNVDDRAAFQRVREHARSTQPHGHRRGRRGGRGPRPAAQGARLAGGPAGETVRSRIQGFGARSIPRKGALQMIGIVIAVLVAALVYWLCLVLGLPSIVGIVAAILVLLGGVGSGGYGMRAGRRL